MVFMLVETLSEESIDGWTKFGLSLLILAFIVGLVFSLMKFSEWSEKSRRHRRRVTGVNRSLRRKEQATKRKRRGR